MVIVNNNKLRISLLKCFDPFKIHLYDLFHLLNNCDIKAIGRKCDFFIFKYITFLFSVHWPCIYNW